MNESYTCARVTDPLAINIANNDRPVGDSRGLTRLILMPTELNLPTALKSRNYMLLKITRTAGDRESTIMCEYTN